VGSGRWAVGSRQQAVGSWQWAVGSGQSAVIVRGRSATDRSTPSAPGTFARRTIDSPSAFSLQPFFTHSLPSIRLRGLEFTFAFLLFTFAFLPRALLFSMRSKVTRRSQPGAECRLMSHQAEDFRSEATSASCAQLKQRDEAQVRPDRAVSSRAEVLAGEPHPHWLTALPIPRCNKRHRPAAKGVPTSL
jgi:hypothetical protein